MLVLARCVAPATTESVVEGSRFVAEAGCQAGWLIHARSAGENELLLRAGDAYRRSLQAPKGI